MTDLRVLVEAQQYVADLSVFKEPQGQAQGVTVEGHGHLQIDSARCVNNQILAYKTGGGLKHGHHEHADKQRVEHVYAALDKHLVDQDLSEDRHRQAEQLKQQRGDE